MTQLIVLDAVKDFQKSNDRHLALERMLLSLSNSKHFSMQVNDLRNKIPNTLAASLVC